MVVPLYSVATAQLLWPEITSVGGLSELVVSQRTQADLGLSRDRHVMPRGITARITVLRRDNSVVAEAVTILWRNISVFSSISHSLSLFLYPLIWNKNGGKERLKPLIGKMD